MRDVSIIGIGQTDVAEHWDRSLRHLAGDAVLAAMSDAGIETADALYVGNMLSGLLTGQEHLGALISDFVGLRGIEAVKAYVTMLFSAFPDFHVNLEDMLVDGDKVVMRSTISGTFKGEFAGLAPTGKHATWSGMGIYRIAGGKIVEAWEELDLLGGFQRLGVIPAMA